MKLEAKARLLAGPDLVSVLKRIANDGRVVMGQQYANDPDKGLIATRGRDWTKIGKLYDGPAGQCHWNVAKLYDRGLIDGIVIGYGHNFQGWHQHTWGLVGNSLVETTVDNKINDHWFGAKLDLKQAHTFVERCTRYRPGMGMIRTTRGGAL